MKRAVSAALGAALIVGLVPATAMAIEDTQTYLIVEQGTKGSGLAPLAREARSLGSNVTAYNEVGALVADLTEREAAALDQRPGVVVAPDGMMGTSLPGEPTGSTKPGGSPLGASALTGQTAGLATARSWGLDRVDQRSTSLSGTYSLRPGVSGSGVHAFVFDSGLSTGHPEFRGRVGWGLDAVGDGYGVQDCNGHGTHVAGTIASSIFGVAPRTTVHPIRVLDCDGSGYWSDFIYALDYVAARAPRNSVANASLGGYYNAAVNAAVNNFVNRGTPLVVSAGNDADDTYYYSPASAVYATTVAALDKPSGGRDRDAFYSNYGDDVDIYAPGTNIWSTYYADPAYAYRLTGTSMAAPHVAGYMALYLQRNPAASISQTKSALYSHSTKNTIDYTYGNPNRIAYTYAVAYPQQVKFRTVNNRSKVRVDVDPSVGAASWKVVIQKKKGSTWKKVRVVRTVGTREVKTVNVARGRYRAVVPAQYGYGKKVSGTVFVRR